MVSSSAIRDATNEAERGACNDNTDDNGVIVANESTAKSKETDSKPDEEGENKKDNESIKRQEAEASQEGM